MRTIEKAWGREEVLVDEPEYCAKRLVISPGKRCSLHYHDIKKETFIVQDGLVRLEYGMLYEGFVGPPLSIYGEDELLKRGESRTIYPTVAHRFSSTHGATILEISTHHDDADVVRLENSGDIA
jgi:mannose-6-phosphate isomerase-like protein (cupin superfamily)